MKEDKKIGVSVVVVGPGLNLGYMDACCYIGLIIYCFYVNITQITNVYTETGKAVAACGTRFGGAVFDEIFSAAYGGIFVAVYAEIWRNFFCTVYAGILGRIFSALYGGIFSAGNAGIFRAICDGIFSVVYGGIFGGVNEIFSAVCGVIIGAVFAGIFIAVGGVICVASYGNKNMRLAQRTGNHDTLTGERKEVQVCSV